MLDQTLTAFTTGEHRALTPAAALSRVQSLLPGIGVTRLANITGLDCIGIPTVAAVRPNAGTLSVSAGKGLTLETAKVSAAMEALELFAAESADIGEVVCSRSELAKHQPVVDVAQLPVSPYSIQLQDRPISWTFGLDLVSEQAVAVPTELVLLRKTRDPVDPFHKTSSGLAAGFARTEAILVGLLELIERDAVACHRRLSRLGGLGLPRVSNESLCDLPLVRRLLNQVEEAGAEVVVYDCTHDSGIPVYLARLFNTFERYTGIYTGSGAHLDPEIAVVRAITEAAQSRTVYIAGSRDDVSGHLFEQHRAHDSPSIVKLLREQPPIVDARGVRSRAAAAFETDIATVLRALEDIGVCICVVVDLTPPLPDSDVSVVRVVVPGLAVQEEHLGSGSARLEQFSRRMTVAA